MRVEVLFIVLMALFLGACAAGGEPGEAGKTEPPPPPTTDQGVPLSMETPTFPAGAAPELAWVNDPSQRVILGTFCCGFTTETYVTNYIPEFQIWGDGRFLWTAIENDVRVIYIAQLGQEEIAAILQTIHDQGFFGWQDRYEDPLVSDLADKCIRISLLVDEKSVCEYYQGAPEAFHQLFDWLAGGAENAGRIFTPGRGFLTATRFETDSAQPDLVLEREDISLEAVGEQGSWVEGEAFQALWAAVNKNPWGPVTEHQGGYYIVTLQVPGLSLRVPPQGQVPD